MKHSLPLGVDIGATRLRVAYSTLTGDGVRVNAVVSREIASGIASSGAIVDREYIGALIDEACMELQAKERRCVLSVGEPDAILRSVEFPKMTAVERERACVFEAQRYVNYSVDEALVRLHPIDQTRHLYALGIVRSATLRSRLEAIKCGGLKPIAADHEALALSRALPGYDAILDIGFERASLHVSGRTPFTFQHAAGGAEITRGIERELSIDSASAEKRKRILGTAGAGESARSAFLADLTSLIETAGARTHGLRRIALVGNGARLNNLATDLERATGLLVELPASPFFADNAYPPDVVKASGPDWNLAAGLSSWSARPA